MNNETIHEYKIKLREDKTYSIYVDGKLMGTKGSIDSVVNELKVIMDEVDNYVIDKTK